MSLQSVNPLHGRPLRAYDEIPPATAAAALAAGATAFASWRQHSLEARAGLLRRLAEVLEEKRENLVVLMAEEMGKPIAQGRAEVDKCAACCRYYAEHGARFLQAEVIPTEASRSYVLFQPLGLILAVMPWNFPFWQVVRAAAPAIMAGNVMALKHASNVPGCALALATVFQQAGFPAGVFQTLLVGSRQVEALIGHPAVQAVTLTGSTPAGRAVAAAAGRALKKTVLELGGNDPYVVLDDADLEQAATVCAAARLNNGGQTCIAAKRFIVVQAVADAFADGILARFQKQVMGNPLDPATTLGPLARHDLRDELHDQVQRSIAAGAVLRCGGCLPANEGAFYPPTLLDQVQANMPVYHEETFGPVATLIRVADEAEAIRVANDSVFGLGAAVFTRDPQRGERVAAQLEAGCCFVNDFVRSDPRLPFGGIRQSGYGRELSSFGIREFVNIKTVCVR